MTTNHRTKERIKQTGEVFTPLELVDEILDKLPPECWNKNKTFLDPSAGDGNFLVQVIKRKLKHNHTAKQALQTTYGVELMPDNVADCKERLLEVVALHEQITTMDAKKKYGKIVDRNIVCSDAFKWDFENWKPLKSRKQQQTELLDDVFEW